MRPLIWLISGKGWRGTLSRTSSSRGSPELKLTTLDKVLYPEADFSKGGYRWLTVVSPEQPDGTELQLELNSNPAAKAYQQAMFQEKQLAAMFYVDDVQAEYDRMKAQDANFKMPPTKVTGSTIAMLDDTCGHLIQIAALDAWGS